ncbi:aquaporin [Synechococcus sp. AH-736-A19]|nr:aquaporin [Synechococcus sp. AH-736-A19]
MTMPLWQRTALEAFGTGFLAFTVGRLGSSEFNGFEQAIVIGLCLAMLIHLMGRATGAHFNPAVTLLLNAQRFGRARLLSRGALRESVAYISAQLLGATVGLGLNPFDRPINDFAFDAWLPEFVFSFVLFGLILRWSSEGRICPVAQPLSGLVIGSGLSVLVLLGSLTESGIYNPAMAIAFAVKGMAGSIIAIVDQFVAAGLMLLLLPSRPQSSD